MTEKKRYKRIDCPEFEGFFQIHDMSNEEESMMCGEDIEYQLNSYEAQIKDLKEVIDQMTEFLAINETLLKDIYKDLLMRAEVDNNGVKLVDLSSSKWIRLKKSIGEE